MDYLTGALVLLVILVVYYIYVKYTEKKQQAVDIALTSANGKSSIPINSFLSVGEYITDGSMFMIQQGDGNLCIYKGSGPSDNKGFVWCSGAAERAAPEDKHFRTTYEASKLSTFVEPPRSARKLLWYMAFPGEQTEIKMSEKGPI